MVMDWLLNLCGGNIHMQKRLVLFLLLIVIMVTGCSKQAEPLPVVEEPEIEEIVEEPEEEEDLPVVLKSVNPVTVVVNNHDEARPQSGLQEARIVYEFLAEGGVTRFLAVYDTLLEGLVIGPVRSLRPYLAVQSVEHGGVIAHSGMSDRTRDMIRGLKIRQVGDAPAYMWRDTSRKAPHNLYTDIERMYKASGESEVREQIVEPAVLPAVFEEGREFELVYYSTNKVSYTYDEEKEVYLRFINGKVHSDRESGLQYNARRVIVRKNKHTNLPGALVDIDLEGKGEGLLYELGRKYEISWEKKDGITSYYYMDGDKVDMSFGNTWIQVVR